MNRGYLLLLCTMLLGLITGCTVSSPFRGPGFEKGVVTADIPVDDVVVSLTYIQTGKDRQLNKMFWRNVSAVYKSMNTQSGLIGFSIRREIFGSQGWTMSVWTDEESVKRFVQSPIHSKAMKNGLSALSRTAFVRLSVAKDEIPLDWKTVEDLLKASARSYQY